MKMRKIISIFIVSTLFLLVSISPVLAEEASPIDLGTGTESTVVETVVDIPAAEDPVVETVVDIPAAEDPVVETVVEIPTAEAPVIETVVDIPDTSEAPTETVTDSAEYLGSDILNVIVPISVSITIDPLELAGKGQVYSNTYNIKNYGDTDVILTFTDIKVTFAEGSLIEPLAQPIDEGLGSELKSIFMKLDFGRSDVPPAVITDQTTKEAISIPLSATQGDTAGDSLVAFNFSGNVNEASALYWHNDDVKISMNYTLVAVPPPVEEITPPAIEVTPLVEETATPAEEAATPAEEAATPAEEAATPAEQTATPAEQTATPAEQTATPAEQTATPAEETATPAESPPPAETSAPESPAPSAPSESPSESST